MHQCSENAVSTDLFPVLSTTTSTQPTTEPTTTQAPLTTSESTTLSTVAQTTQTIRVSTSAVDGNVGNASVFAAGPTISVPTTNLSEVDSSRSIPTWVLIVVVIVFFVFLLVLIFVSLKRRKNVQNWWSKIDFQSKESRSDEKRVHEELGLEVNSTAPSEYEEIISSKQVVDNILYEPNADTTNSNYDHLWKNKTNPSATNYNTIQTNTECNLKQEKSNKIHIFSDNKLTNNENTTLNSTKAAVYNELYISQEKK